MAATRVGGAVTSVSNAIKVDPSARDGGGDSDRCGPSRAGDRILVGRLPKKTRWKRGEPDGKAGRRWPLFFSLARRSKNHRRRNH